MLPKLKQVCCQKSKQISNSSFPYKFFGGSVFSGQTLVPTVLFWLWCKCKKFTYLKLLFCCCCCSVVQSCLILCNPMDCSKPGFPVLHHLPELGQTHVHWVGDVIQPSHPLSSPSPPDLNLSQHQGLFQWVGASHQMARVLELQPQHQCLQWIFRIDFLSNALLCSCSPRDSQ